MARVIGIPLTKGNSEVVVSVQILEADLATIREGQAVYLTDAAPVSGEKVVTTDSANGSLFGFAMDINKCSHMASCVRSAEAVYLPASANFADFASGDALTIDAATGLADPAGAIITNGVVELPVTELLDGKSGDYIREGVCVRFAGLRDVTPTP